MGSSRPSLDDDSATESDSATKTDSDSETETDEDLPSTLDSSPFAVGERVLAYHEVLVYDAKVINAVCRRNVWRFFIHYCGWSKNWDEWVSVDRLLKYTEENLQLKQELQKKYEADKPIRPGRPFEVKPRSSSVGRGKKRKPDSHPKEKVGTTSEKLVNLQIPSTLRKQLVDDCEFITHLGKLVRLPRIPNVDDILKKYLDYMGKKDGMVHGSVEEILKGIRCYFDKALPAMLLYKSERQQYAEVIIDDVSPSTVYGAEHLLRLFVKLPELLLSANIEDETLSELQQRLADFLKFLQKNHSAFFLSTYHVAEDVETSTNNKQDN